MGFQTLPRCGVITKWTLISGIDQITRWGTQICTASQQGLVTTSASTPGLMTIGILELQYVCLKARGHESWVPWVLVFHGTWECTRSSPPSLCLQAGGYRGWLLGLAWRKLLEAGAKESPFLRIRKEPSGIRQTGAVRTALSQSD